MTLRVRFREGERNGTFLDFGDERETIRFGRDAAHCDVVFDVHDTRVSREHFSLRRVNGQYRLLTNRKTSVLVDGKEGDDDQVLGKLSLVQVGEGGPKVLVEIVEDARFESTVDLGRVAPPLAAQARAIREEARRAKRLGLLAVAVVALVGVAGFAGFHLGRKWLAKTEGEVAGALDRVARFEDDVAQKLRDAKPAFQAIYARVERSVCRVELRTRIGASETYQPAGTAWVAGPSLLATNAHVARSFEELRRDESLVVRGGPEVAVVKSVKIHPGYLAFETLMSEASGKDPVIAGEIDLIPGCDVALLEIAPEDAARFGPPLAVAEHAVLEELEAGSPLAFVGFPAEGMVHNGTDTARPRPTFQVGHVTGVTDFFLGRAAPAEAEFLHFNMPAAGGASGSPLFDAKGRVIGILNAGNFRHFEGGSRVPIGGVTYGQRADVLLELLEGRADGELARRSTQWRGELARLFARGSGGLMVGLARSFETYLREQGFARPTGVDEVHAAKGSLTASGEPNAVRFEVDAPEDGWYLVVAAAERAVDIDATVTVDRQTANDFTASWFTRSAFHTRRGSKIELAVFTHVDPALLPIDFGVKIFRATE